MQKIDRLRTLNRQEIQKIRFVYTPTHPVLAALDYRNNDLFRCTFGSEDELSQKILTAFYPICLTFRLHGCGFGIRNRLRRVKKRKAFALIC